MTIPVHQHMGVSTFVMMHIDSILSSSAQTFALSGNGTSRGVKIAWGTASAFS